MENATKALLIAASVLFTLAVISMFFYFYNLLKEFPEQQEEAIRLEQISKFNAEYESYNKKKMYGTDVITVMNKAIDNNVKYSEYLNKSYALGNHNAETYIDVWVTLKTDIEAIAIRYYPEGSDNLVNPHTINNGSVKGKPYGNGTTKTYNLGTIFDSGTIKLMEKSGHSMKKNVVNFFSSSNFESVRIAEQNAPYTGFDDFHYTLVKSGFTDFKRKIFSCTAVEYNPNTSYISRIIFEEIDSDDD